MKKQKTFYNACCDIEATEWLNKLANCFDIKNASIKSYKVKGSGWHDNGERCRVIVTYK